MRMLVLLTVFLTPVPSLAEPFTLTSGTWRVGETGHTVFDLQGPRFQTRGQEGGAFSHGPGVLLPTHADLSRPLPPPVTATSHFTYGGDSPLTLNQQTYSTNTFGHQWGGEFTLTATASRPAISGDGPTTFFIRTFGPALLNGSFHTFDADPITQATTQRFHTVTGSGQATFEYVSPGGTNSEESLWLRSVSVVFTPIPEPSTWLMLLSGVIGMMSYRAWRNIM